MKLKVKVPRALREELMTFLGSLTAYAPLWNEAEARRARQMMKVAWKKRAKPYGGKFVTPSGTTVSMYRGRYNRVRFYTASGRQVGPEQDNVAPAIAYALHHGWRGIY